MVIRDIWHTSRSTLRFYLKTNENSGMEAESFVLRYL